LNAELNADRSILAVIKNAIRHDDLEPLVGVVQPPAGEIRARYHELGLQPVVHRVGDELASHLLQAARALVVDGGGAGVEEHGDGAALRLAHHVHQEQALPVGPAMVVVEARGPS